MSSSIGAKLKLNDYLRNRTKLMYYYIKSTQKRASQEQTEYGDVLKKQETTHEQEKMLGSETRDLTDTSQSGLCMTSKGISLSLWTGCGGHHNVLIRESEMRRLTKAETGSWKL